MKISGVDFPIELLNALRDGNLVVFAGAGVSMGPPACLPKFSGLAKEIAEGTGEERGEYEPEDRFLGRLKHRGVHVHERSAQVLSGERGEPPAPNDLHFNILRLYSHPESLRLVTTNFDLLFEQAASDVFEATPTSYSAPVLPLGGDFEGIVHVHGDLNRPRNAVLTDADFGRAYLTEGWARRFLAALFSSFPVLFIGYSHNDVAMNYLARALTVSGTTRFALAKSDEDDAERYKWELFDIQRIEYPKSPCDNHRGLYDAMSGLVDFVRRDSNDWKSRIMRIAEQPPPDDEEQVDLMDYAFSDAELTNYFTEADNPPEWIAWLGERDDIGGLFTTDRNYTLSERDEHLSRWLAEKFSREHADQLFHLFGQHGMRLHPALWWRLGQVIGEETDIPIEPETLSRWVSLFLSTPPSLSAEHVFGWLTWENLGERCMEASLVDSCIDIFELMADGRLELNRPFAQFAGRHFKPEVRAEFKPVCGHATINGLWIKALKPNLDDVAVPLLARIVEILDRRHRVLQAWQAAKRIYDPLGRHRKSIIRGEGYFVPKPIDVLIDAARDCLEYLTEQSPEAVGLWSDRFVNAESPFVRMLAVHALSVRNDMSETEKIDWLLSRHDIHDLPTKTETFQVLRSVYPFASPQQREALIGAVLAYRWPREDDAGEERSAAYVHFEWLYLLNQSDPSCELTEQALEDVWKGYPDFLPREGPGTITIREDDWIGNESPWSAEELLARPAGEWTDELLSFQSSDLLGPNREGLQDTVEAAAKQDFEWGLQLGETLSAAGNWHADLWPPLLRSWGDKKFQAQHGRVLGYLRNSALHAQHGNLVVEALIAVVSSDGVASAPELLSEANQIAKELGRHSDQIYLEPTVDDWLFQAINNIAGKLAQFWLLSLDVWRKQQEPNLVQMSSEYRSVLSEFIIDTTLVGLLGKSVLARYSAHLLEADEQWTTSNLLPLFGRADDIPMYQAVWEGFLSGRKTLHLAGLLKDPFFEALSHLNTYLAGGRRRERFVRDFVLMLEYIVSDPSEILTKWIPKFFANTDEEDRVRFGQDVAARIERMEDDQQRKWWDSWLGRYLENRLQGVPAPLAPGEVGAILGWIPYFNSVFPDVVALAVKMPPQQLDQSDVLFRIRHGTLWETYPESVAALLTYLDKCTLPPWVWHYDGKELISKLQELNLADDVKWSLLTLSDKRGLNLQNDES